MMFFLALFSHFLAPTLSGLPRLERQAQFHAALARAGIAVSCRKPAVTLRLITAIGCAANAQLPQMQRQPEHRAKQGTVRHP